ncbi:rifin PIR protein, putative [Plasmodium reichenowi]|uniref:Rifin PIR protein, putative n=1 Tax=Plasmodium reichenowi TaxID=5854 RepID=A0A2P9DSB4_PLARE|nr:rifin PIR protein, putative [Plasmodium reichenowi]
MKVHYINILLFALPLNILAHNKNKPSITPRHIQTTRLLCQCELYTSIYGDDPEMKKVLHDFDRQTSQRFKEYDDRMVEKRQKCKEQCDKEIQKIILKDKLEKQMAQQLDTLETKITTDDIPTCVCEKSLADKVEKECLKCTQNLGGIVAPSSGVLGGIGEAAISLLKPLALDSAKDAALAEATDAAIEAGMNAVRHKIKVYLADFINEKGFVDFTSIVSKSNFKYHTALFQNAKELLSDSCIPDKVTKSTNSFCNTVIKYGGEEVFKPFAEAGATTHDATLTTKTAEFTSRNMAAVNTTYGGYHVSIIASIVAIVVIVLIMVIIYLILRYRRKKKMKKKLQYIKLLEE